MKKYLIILAVILCVGITAGTAFLVVRKDRTGPEIKVSEESSLVYAAGQDNKLLLKGVTAVDARDGDVSDTLLVESVRLNSAGDKAEVVYTAVDKSNNVTKLKCEINVGVPGSDGSNVETPQEPQSTENPEGGATETSPTPSEPAGEQPAENQGQTGETAASDQPAEGQDNSNTNTNTDTEAAIAALPQGSPQFRLKAHETTLPVGGKFVYGDYIESIKDDKDDESSLYRRIRIRGEVQADTPGTYEISYYVLDSDGNQSNTEVLKVNIQ